MALTNAPADTGQDVFDVSNWLERASARPTIATPDYSPRHRAEVPVDSVV